MMITNPKEEYFKDGLWGWKDDEWLKLGRLFSFDSSCNEGLSAISTVAGGWVVTSTVVPANKIYVIQKVVLANYTRSITTGLIYMFFGGQDYPLASDVNIPQYVSLVTNGPIIMSEGMYIKFVAYGVQIGDDMQATVLGYRMAL